MKDQNTEKFVNNISRRSAQNEEALKRLMPLQDTVSPAISILRQELESMVKVLFLLQTKDLEERRRLIGQTLSGEKWTQQNSKGIGPKFMKVVW